MLIRLARRALAAGFIAATRASILRELKKLQSTSPQDSVVTFFAGHGAMSGSHFVFLPVDARVESRESMAASGIRSDELSQALTAIPATSR